jgi:hypothetical protein
VRGARLFLLLQATNLGTELLQMNRLRDSMLPSASVVELWILGIRVPNLDVEARIASYALKIATAWRQIKALKARGKTGFIGH